MREKSRILSYIYFSMAVLSTLVTAALITLIYFSPKDLINNEKVRAETFNPDARSIKKLVENTGNAVYKIDENSTITPSLDFRPVFGRHSSILAPDGSILTVSFLLDREQQKGSLRLTKCSTPGCQNPRISVLDDNVGAYWLDESSISIGKDGNPIVSYYTGTKNRTSLVGSNGECEDPDQPGECDLKVVKCANLECSQIASVVTVDSGGDVGQYSSIVVDNIDGLPIIAYWEGRSRALRQPDGSYMRYCESSSFPANEFCNLKLVKCGDEKCSNNKILRLDSSGPVGRFSQLKLDKNRFPTITYLGGAYGYKQIKLLKCTNIECSSNVMKVLDQTDSNPINAFNSPSMILRGDDLPIIAYYLVSESDDLIVFAKCNDTSCNNVQKTTVDYDKNANILNILSGISINVDVNNIPILGYFKEMDNLGLPNANFNVLKCGNQFCNLLNSISTTKLTNRSLEIGRFSSIINNNNPIISYTEYLLLRNVGSIKNIQCSDNKCSNIATLPL